MKKQIDFLFCKNLINDFISEYLNGNIFGFLDFDFKNLKHDSKYGCRGRSFDCDDTNLSKAIYFLLWEDIYPNLSLQDIGTGKLYRGDTLNTFNTLLGTYLPEKQVSDGLIKSNAPSRLIELTNQFHRTYHTIGNFILLPNIAETNCRGSYTFNTYRGIAFKDYFDLFLQKLELCYIDESIDLHLSALIKRNDFFFSWLSSMGGFKFLKEICWLDDYFDGNKPKTIFAPYVYCLRKKKEWTDKEKIDYIKYSEKYILDATSIIKNRAIKMIAKLKTICNK